MSILEYWLKLCLLPWVYHKV